MNNDIIFYEPKPKQTPPIDKHGTQKKIIFLRQAFIYKVGNGNA